jgi:hypothetical protein
MEREETGAEKRKEGRKVASTEVRIILVSIVREEISDRVQGGSNSGDNQKKDFWSGSGGQYTREFPRPDYRTGSGGQYFGDEEKGGYYARKDEMIMKEEVLTSAV